MRLLPIVLFACTTNPLLSQEPSCDHRGWLPDEDGDGVGETTALYVGCDAPEGWVELETDPSDSEPSDSEPSDSEPSDSEPSDAEEPAALAADSGRP